MSKTNRLDTHIVSLQRTGSKSLYNALHRMTHKPLSFNLDKWVDPLQKADRSLGEFFHCWSHTGYKFGANANYPFDPSADVYFRGEPEFQNVQHSSSFDVVPRLDGSIGYERCDYRPQLTLNNVRDRVELLQQVKGQRNFIVKTQLASLVEDLHQAEVNPSAFQAMITSMNELFDVTFAIMPDDPVRWLCSNYLCDHTGVFIPNDEQERHAQGFVAQPVTIPSEYIKLLYTRLYRHRMWVYSMPNVAVIKTSMLSDAKTMRWLRNIYNDDTIIVKNTQEFSRHDYRKMIANYDEVHGAFNSGSHQ